MSRFILFFCLDLLLLVIMLFLPNSIMNIHLLSIFGIVSLVLVIISACLYGSFNDTFLMLVLLVAINWAVFSINAWQTTYCTKPSRPLQKAGVPLYCHYAKHSFRAF